MTVDANTFIRDIRAAVKKAELAKGTEKGKTQVIREFGGERLRIAREHEISVAIERIPATIGEAVAQGKESVRVGKVHSYETNRITTWVNLTFPPPLSSIKKETLAGVIIAACEAAGLKLRLEYTDGSSWDIIITNFNV